MDPTTGFSFILAFVKNLIAILVFSFLCVQAACSVLDSLLFAGYEAKSEENSLSLFSEAFSHVDSEEDLTFYYYFKYYYHYQNKNADSTSFYEEIVLPRLLKDEEYSRYFAIRENHFWDLLGKGNSDKAIARCLEDIEKAKALNLPLNESISHSNLANAYHNIAFYEKGIAHGKTAVQIAKEKVYDQNYSVYVGLNAIAINFDDWNKPDSAIYYHRKVMQLDSIHEGELMQTYNNIGNTYLKQQQLDSADFYISKAVALNQKYRSNYGLATSMNNKADVLLRLKQFEKAQFWADSALIFAEASNNLEKKRDVYNTLYRLNEKLDNQSEAFTYLQKFHAAKDSMVNAEKLQLIKDLEQEKLAAEKEKVIALKESQLRKRNVGIAIVLAGLIITLLGLRQLILKRKHQAKKAELEVQNERLRISRDLHDNIGAELTYLTSVLDQKIYTEKSEKKKDEYKHLSESTRNAMTQLRETIWAIQTEEINLEKFKSKLQQLSQRYSKALGIQLNISLSGENLILPPAVTISLFRICQEAINNSVKYAECSEINIGIEGVEKEVHLKISDNGKGFDPDEVKRGYGLANMEERIKELNGEFNFRSQLGEGTWIEVKVPLHR